MERDINNYQEEAVHNIHVWSSISSNADVPRDLYLYKDRVQTMNDKLYFFLIGSCITALILCGIFGTYNHIIKVGYDDSLQDYKVNMQVRAVEYKDLEDYCYNISRTLEDRYYNMSIDLYNTSLELHNVKMFCHERNLTAPMELTNENKMVLGLAFGDTFLIYTVNRTITQVLEACAHEYAHNKFGLLDP